MMEKSQGGSSILSLRVTTAAWFNETVCHKAKQQPVNKQAEVTHAEQNADRLSKTLLSFFLTYRPKNKQTNTCSQRFWLDLRQAMETVTVWVCWEETRPIAPKEMNARGVLTASSNGGAVQGADAAALDTVLFAAAEWKSTQTSVMKIKQKLQWMMGFKSKVH